MHKVGRRKFDLKVLPSMYINIDILVPMKKAHVYIHMRLVLTALLNW